MTSHPHGKKGMNVDKQRYELMKVAITVSLKGKQLTHTELLKLVRKRLNGKLKGSLPWYFEVVKLDLEARKIIKRIHNTKPQLYKLTK